MKKSITCFQVRWLHILTTILLFVCGLNVHAQNVTIRANNGSCIASAKNGGTTDTFFNAGGFATWQHEQLALVMTVADDPDLTDHGQLSNPANNLFKTTDGQYIQIGKGQATGANVCYVSLSLPSGYRFTGYTMTFSKPSSVPIAVGNDNPGFNTTNDASTFGETDNTFNTYKTSASIVRGAASQTITRTQMAEGDMTNVLYFKLQGPDNSRALITLESVELYFTAEEDYSPSFAPGSQITTGVSAVDIPFSTSKVDYGSIISREYNGIERVSYSSANVTDLEANFVLYEEGSVVDGTGIDDVSGKLVNYGAGTITTEGKYFKLGSENQEQIYFIETPTYVTLSNGTHNPVGYRIVGADIEYTRGGGSSSVTKYYISYIQGGQTYYLNTSGEFVTSPKTEWKLDDEGYVYSGNTYIGRQNGDFTIFTSKPTTTGNGTYLFSVNGDRLSLTSRSGTTYYLVHSSTTANLSQYTNNAVSWAPETEYFEISASDFTLYIYDKKGEYNEGEDEENNVGQKIVVNEQNPSGTVHLTGLNNDAVKFGVKGIGHITGTLTLQALDPYIDRMSVVCQDQVQTAIRMEQYFTASDFSVSGGTFYFYLPTDCNGHEVLISYEDLKSKYADETYTGGSVLNNSRYNFVKSAHYNAFDNAFGTTSNNIYGNLSEASNAQLERLKVNIVGTKKFKFNNADEVGTSGGTLTEYPFSLERYNNTDYTPFPNPNPENLSVDFDQMKYTVTSADQQKIRYVFTTDETRYNIAPTTATQHRAYAYYTMEVHVQSSTYSPEVTFVPIYKNALYEDENGNRVEGDFYGAVVTAVDGNGKPGYSSTQEIFRVMDNKIQQGIQQGTQNMPTSHKQLLYLDFSQLAGVYEITTEQHQSMEDYAATNAANCLIFIPAGQSAPNNNIAYKTENGFRAANNIVITDNQPFYSPYDIQVDGANYAKYERKLTSAMNGKVTKASIMLPFIILVDEDGKHTNAGDTKPAFSLHQMQPTGCLSDEPVEDGDVASDDEAYVFFPKISTGSITTEANTPYLVRVLEDGVPSSDKLSFVVIQTGSTIYKTPGRMHANNYTFAGETATGSSNSVNYAFTSYATYSGKKLKFRENNETYFYFANNKFVSSDQLFGSHNYVYMYPFRAYYATNKSNNQVKGLSQLGVIFGEGIGNYDDTPTGIRRVNDNSDLMIAVGKGYITITATKGQNVVIHNIGGATVNNVAVKAGETQTVGMPAGVYIVNGTKIVVR